MEMRSSPQTGTPHKNIGNFEIIEKLGQGAMGAVYKARQKALDRIVALKILPPDIAADEQFIERFKREAQTSAKLNHPNIVQGIDVGRDEATKLWYFAMEFVDGPSLQKILNAEKTLAENRVLEISLDVARALECAERSGIVHRDIKPDNILVSKDGSTKLADLGLAKRTTHEDENAALTQAGKAVGTPYYMSPEQIRGEVSQIDIRTDIYALGATMFHLLTGRTPFQGNNAAVIMTQHLTAKTPLTHHVNPDVSEATSRLIANMMARERDKRPESAGALVQKLEALLNRGKEGGRSGFASARKAGRLGTTGPLAPVRDGTTGPRVPIRDATTGPRQPVQPREDGVSRGALVLGGAGAVLLLAVVVFLFSGNSKTPAKPPSQESSASAKKYAEDPAEKVALAKPSREQLAQAAYDSLVKFAGLPPDDVQSRIERTKAFLAEHGTSIAAHRARTMLEDLESQTVKKRNLEPVAEAPASPPIPDRSVPPPVQEAPKPAIPVEASKPAAPKADETGDDSPERVFATIKDALAKAAPLLKQNQFEAAKSELKKKLSETLPPASIQTLNQEVTDVNALWKMRLGAMEALRKRAGEEIKVKKGNSYFSGMVKAEAEREGLTLKVKDGPELTLSAGQLNVEDVVAHAPAGNLNTWEVLRLKGLAYLAAGELEAAKRLLTEAKEAGAGKAADFPLYRIKVVEMGEMEAMAAGVWDKAEGLFEAKKLKEAEAVYVEFREKFGATELMRKNKEKLATRLDAIDCAFKPKFTFRANESMQMFDAGARFGNFPVMENADPLGPFSSKPAYFKQKTGVDVVYEINSPNPMTSLRWKGAAMQNMTIEIVDMEGKSIKKGGPYNGGNVWAEFTLEFPAQKHFVLRLQNHISTWYFINELEFK